MKIDEVIEKLQDFRNEYGGNIEVFNMASGEKVTFIDQGEFDDDDIDNAHIILK